MQNVEDAQKQLNELYYEYFVKRYEEIKKDISLDVLDKLSTPYLLHVPEHYYKGKRIWYVAQEPFEYYGFYEKSFLRNERRKHFHKDDSVEYAVNVHKKLLSGNSINSPIWKYFKSLGENLNKKIIFNNIYKFSYVEAGLEANSKLFKPTNEKKYLEPIIKLQQDVLLKEMEILDPELIIFMTGHPNDPLFFDRLGSNGLMFEPKQYDVGYEDIKEAIVLGINKWKLGKLDFSKFYHNKNIEIYRTYHPRYLSQTKNFTQEQKEFIQRFLQNKIEA